MTFALPSIQARPRHVRHSPNYIVTAYATVPGGFLLLGRRLADSFGRRRMLQTGFVMFVLASLATRPRAATPGLLCGITIESAAHDIDLVHPP
ncbi:MAG TPA: hypothetical protein VF129_05950 [Actinomycetota bacterium]